MKILLLASAFNGLTQRAWLELRRAGHDVTVELSVSPQAMREAVELADPDLIICPFLKDRVPAEIWQRRRTIIVHPGPPGDRGPSSLDWAVTEAAPCWGVTALQAVEEMDAGDIWASRTFPLPAEPPAKSALYNGLVTDTAVELIHEVVRKAADPAFVPTPLDYSRADVWGRLRPPLRQPDRAFDWADDSEHILRRVRAADGSPGVLTVVVRAAGLCLRRASWAARPPASRARPRRGGTARCWSAPAPAGSGSATCARCRPATVRPSSCRRRWCWPTGSPECPSGPPRSTPARTSRTGRSATGATGGSVCSTSTSTTAPCRPRSAAGWRPRCGTRPSRTPGCWCSAAADPPASSPTASISTSSTRRRTRRVEGWRNIVAIDDVCRQLLTATRQIVVAAVAGNAGAGGVMLALGADHVLLREGTVLNPHYQSMGLFGSEYWTYALPRRVGRYQAERLTGDCLPIGAAEAVSHGLADAALPRDPAAFDAAVAEYAHRLAGCDGHSAAVDAQAAAA